jgi:hypothetical protein
VLVCCSVPWAVVTVALTVVCSDEIMCACQCSHGIVLCCVLWTACTVFLSLRGGGALPSALTEHFCLWSNYAVLIYSLVLRRERL